jgi:hypothetical protein
MEFRHKKMVLGGWVALLFVCLALGFVLERIEVSQTGIGANILLMKDAIFVGVSTMLLLPMLAAVLGSLLPHASSEHGDWHWLLGRPVGREQVFRARLVFDAIVFLAAVLLYYALAFSFKHAGIFLLFGVPFWLAIYGLSAWSRSRGMSSIPSVFVALVGSICALLLLWKAFDLGWSLVGLMWAPRAQWDAELARNFSRLRMQGWFWFRMWGLFSVFPLGGLLFVMGVKSAKMHIQTAPVTLKNKTFARRWLLILAGFYLFCVLSAPLYYGTLYLMARP